MKKRILSLLLALVMIVGMLPTVALAADEAEPAEVADAQTEQVEPAGTKKEPAAPEAKLAEVSEQAANGSETAVYAAPGTTKIDDKDYYQLGSKEDLEWFRDQVNSGNGTINAVLTNDIDLGNENWTPIGKTRSFSGTFDGGNYTISGLYISGNVSSSAILGLFGETSGARIQNLVVRGSVSATILSGNLGSYYIAGVVGQTQNTILEQVASYVDVTGVNKNNGSNPSAVGGLVANGYKATIINCANYGTITSTDSADGDYNRANVGGLSGMSPYGGTLTIENSLNAGAVTGPYASGLISVADSGTTVKNSVSLGNVTGKLGGTFTDCLATENTINASGVTTVDALTDASVLTTLGTAFKTGKDGLPILSWMQEDTSESWTAPVEGADGFYPLASKKDLEWFRDQVNGGKGTIKAKLTDDIDLNGANWTPIGMDYNHQFKGTLDGDGHTISRLVIDAKTADSSGNMEVGLFGEINAATIKNLTVEGSVTAEIPSSTYGGVYIAGVAASNQGASKLENVTSNVTVTVTGNGGYMILIGGLAANASSLTMQGCANLGNVSTENGTVAGLGCAGWGTVTVLQSYNAGNISGKTGNVGGLCAVAGGKAKVTNSFNCSDVRGESGNVGGIASQGGSGDDWMPLIQGCYNTGLVTATTGKAGGLAGGTDGVACYSYSIGDAFCGSSQYSWNCYATSNNTKSSGVTVVTFEALKDSTDKINGTATSGSDYFVENKPYTPRLKWEDASAYPATCGHPTAKQRTAYTPDTESGKQHTVTVTCSLCGVTIGEPVKEACSGAKGVCGKCGQQYCDHANATAGYEHIPGTLTHTTTKTCPDCGNVETQTDECVKENGKCKFCGEDMTGVPEQDTDGYFKLTSEAELVWFRDQVNSGAAAINGRVMNNIELANAWTPIGTDGNSFAGVFDGNQKTISGMNVSSTTGGSCGLFASVGGTRDASAEIKDLKVTGTVTVNAPEKSGVRVGGVVAVLGANATVSGVIADVTVNVTCGKSSGVGGIVGQTSSETAKIERSANLGSVTANAAYVGGIVGYGCGNVLTSYNAGAITGSGCVGGIVGEEHSSGRMPTIEDCYNIGAVKLNSETGYAGGLVGYCNRSKLFNCYNTGFVAPAKSKRVGALAGYYTSDVQGQFKTCYAVQKSVALIAELSAGDAVKNTIDARLVRTDVLRRATLDENGLNKKDKYNVSQNGSFKINPGKTPALIWEDVAECTHTGGTVYVYAPILDTHGVSTGKHTKTEVCAECLQVITEQPVTTEEYCIDSGDGTCVHCDGEVCKHDSTDKKYTYVVGSKESQGQYMHTVVFTCDKCSKSVSYTELCDITTTSEPCEGELFGVRHEVSVACAHCNLHGGRRELCVDGTNGSYDEICDVCGAKLKYPLPHVETGDGFADTYQKDENGSSVTRYYVEQYEVGAEADELVVLAGSGTEDGKIEYQWYYRTQEDALDKDGNPVAGTPVAGATDYAFTPSTDAQTEMRFYYCEVTNSKGGKAVTPAQPVIVCDNPTVTAYFSLTNDDKYIVANNTGASGSVMAFQKVTVPYFDLGQYGLEGAYFKSETYGPVDPDKPMGGSALTAGTSATAYGKITDLHLMIYMLERDYCGLPEAQCGKGYLKEHDLMGEGSTILEIDGGAGSILVRHYWDHDMNFNYYQNYVYPLASEGWGATADQILLKNGDIFTLAMFKDWGFYTKSGAGFQHLGTEVNNRAVRIDVDGTQTSLELTLYRSYGYDQDKYDTKHTPVANTNIYITPASTLKTGTVGTSDWTFCGATDAKGDITIDLTKLTLTAGQDYLLCTPGQAQGQGDDAIVACPGGVLLHVKAAEKTVTVVEADGTQTELTVEEGDKVAKPATPAARPGYRFSGWYGDAERSEKFDFTQKIRNDTTIYAGWTANTYTVAFDANGAEGSMASMDFTYDAEQPLTKCGFTRDGYSFRGWSLTADGSAVYSDGAVVKNLTTQNGATVTLYAVWQKNGSSGTTGGSSAAKPSKNDVDEDKLPFTDVSAKSWYYDGVAYAYENGLMTGTGTDRFSPDADTTRGMIVTILARLEGKDTSGTPWYAAGQKWAMANGISDGTNMPGAITREQLAAILYRYAKQKGYDVSGAADLNAYTDASSVSAYATDAMRWAVANGLIQGSGSKLAPKATATRAQVAAILMRFLELYAK